MEGGPLRDPRTPGDMLREDWLRYGELPLYGARVFIPPEGDKIHLARGDWEATMT